MACLRASPGVMQASTWMVSAMRPELSLSPPMRSILMGFLRKVLATLFTQAGIVAENSRVWRPSRGTCRKSTG